MKTSIIVAAFGLFSMTSTVSAQSYVTVSAQSRLACPAHVGGDLDFGGNGPDTHAEVVLRVTPDRKTLQLHLILNMIETRSDWTEGDVVVTYNLANAPTNKTFTDIWNGSTWIPITGVEIGHRHIDFTDTSTALNTFSASEFWQSKIEIRGDTNNADLGFGCGNLAEDSHLKAYLSTLYVFYN